MLRRLPQELAAWAIMGVLGAVGVAYGHGAADLLAYDRTGPAGLGSPALVSLEASWNAVALSDSVLGFGSVTTGQTHSLGVTLTNNLDIPVDVTRAGFEESVFWTDLGPMEIPAHASHDFQVYFSSIQDVNYTDFLTIDVEAAPAGGPSAIGHSLVARVSAQAAYPDTYYSVTQNKWGQELKAVLTDLIDGHTALGYNTARDSMYGSIDNVAGWVECVYTGRKAFFNTRAGATANNFNCEHTWPQSFSNDAEPMRSDIFHLYPTDETANTKRADLDFGVVTSVTWTVGGSKLGTDAQGQQVFEPRDVHKGNVARSIFYYVIRYNGAYNHWENASKMESWLRIWHVTSPVDSAEQARNRHIYKLQHNRNPFIDHPELVDRISSFFGTAVHTVSPEIAVAPGDFSFGTIGFDTTACYYVAIINTGEDTLRVSSISSTNPAFTVGTGSLNLAPESFAYVAVTYASGETALTDSTKIVVSSNDSDESLIQIPASVEVGGNAGVAGRPLAEIRLYQNQPNPFGRETTISFEIARPQPVSLTVYNIRGQMVSRILRGDWQAAGRHEVHFTAAGLPPGVYYCRLAAGGKVETKSMLFLARGR
ncbi:MAG TPA: endonuclease [bacterium]|nr:endonuclease [bacterium]